MYHAILILAICLFVLAFADALTGARGARWVEKLANIRWGGFLYRCGFGLAVLWLALVVWVVYPRVLAPVIVHAPLPAACSGQELSRACRLAILEATRNGTLAPDKIVEPSFALIFARAERPAILALSPLALMVLIGFIRALRAPRRERLALR